MMSRMMITLSMFFAGLLSADVAFSSDQEVFFHLHQAIGHLEALQTGRCPQAQPQMEAHLQHAEALLTNSPSETFRQIYNKTKDLAKSINSITAEQVEALRMELHDLGKKEGLKHLDVWREEFSRTC